METYGFASVQSLTQHVQMPDSAKTTATSSSPRWKVNAEEALVKTPQVGGELSTSKRPFRVEEPAPKKSSPVEAPAPKKPSPVEAQAFRSLGCQKG